MNFFCRLFGHTWVPKSEDPKIRWNTSKSMNELEPTVSGEPRFFLECARCKEQKEAPTAEDLRVTS